MAADDLGVLEPAQSDPDLSAARASVLAEVEMRGRGLAPSLRPLSLNNEHLIRPLAAPLNARVEARVAAGFSPEGHDYPSSRAWSRVVVPAVAVASLDLIVLIVAGIAAALGAHVAGTIALVAFAIFIAAGSAAVGAAIPPMRDPLRLTTAERRELSQARCWQSRQTWMGPRSATPEYRLLSIARDTVADLAQSPAWASQYLDDHRLRLNLAAELDAIDLQAIQLANLRTNLAGGAGDTHEEPLGQAWGALVDRVAQLRSYATRVLRLDAHVSRSETAALAARLDATLGRIAAGAALDQFAAEHVRALSQDLQRLTATSFATLPESEK